MVGIVSNTLGSIWAEKQDRSYLYGILKGKGFLTLSSNPWAFEGKEAGGNRECAGVNPSLYC